MDVFRQEFISVFGKGIFQFGRQ